MKKKLALLMAAIMTVAMVPMTALAAAGTKINAVDQIKVAVDGKFESRVEIKKDELATDVADDFWVEVTLENGKFTKYEDANGDEKYVLDKAEYDNKNGVLEVKVINDKTAQFKVWDDSFNAANGQKAVVVKLPVTALEVGDVVAKFESNVIEFADCAEVIATAYEDAVVIESAGVVTFVENGVEYKNLKDITIEGLVNGSLAENGSTTITLGLKGDYKFCTNPGQYGTWAQTVDAQGNLVNLGMDQAVTLLNDNISIDFANTYVEDDKIVIALTGVETAQVAKIRISGIAIKTTKKTDIGDVAKLNVVSKDFDKVTLEVAKMVEEAVTYTVEDKKLPVIWAGAWNNDENTLKVSIEENTGDILNTSRKATFTFPEGIEVVDAYLNEGLKIKGAPNVVVSTDENVVTIRNYSTKAESTKVDMDVEFVLNAAPTFEGDVVVTLGGEFDDVEFTVATVKAPYTIEAKTSEVLIDYRYVPVNEIVITEAEEGILEDDDQIVLAVEKMDFEDAGDFEVTEGDIEVDVEVASEDIGLNYAYLTVTVEDDSTEASTIVISGLELYLDRTLPVGGYELIESRYVEDDYNSTILWENSTAEKEAKEEDHGYEENGYFKYEEIVVNDSYVEVVTQARDQDDYSTSKKIVITIGAPTMTVGTQVINLVTPAYINAENFTELPLRAVSEAFGADVIWDDATKTVTVMMGQRIVSMTIGGRTMYINGTPVAMSTAPEITNDFTFVPVRDLANALGISKIDWNAAAATVTLN